MTININFQKITASTISGGGIFLGQNIALGWDAFTKSNTGISNGNHSPIKNTVVIVDDRDLIDAPMIDADHPIAKVKADPPTGDPGGGSIPGSRRVIRKDSEGGNNNQLVIKQDGEQVYPKSQPGMKKAASMDDDLKKSSDLKRTKAKKKSRKASEKSVANTVDPSKAKKIQSRYDWHAADKRKRSGRIHKKK